MQREEVLAMYEQSGALLRGHFVLSSGRHADTYLQSALVLMDLGNAERLARALVEKLPAGFACDYVCAPAIGGLVIGQEVARLLKKPYIFTERKHGVMQLRRGFRLFAGARVLIVEDVVTTGGSVKECAMVVDRAGGRVVQILALVDRAPETDKGFPAPFAALLDLSVPSWVPEACPLCRDPEAGPPVRPGSRQA